MKGWLNINGSFIENGSAVITADNRGFRYGDGVFETMRVVDGEIALGDHHFERLYRGISTLHLGLPSTVTPAYFADQIRNTLERNGIEGTARVRLTVFRGDGGLYEPDGPGGGWIIQAWPIPRKQELNAGGLILGVYEDGKKACDLLANVKSNNFLVYVMAALYAKASRWDDCLVLNTMGRVCESTNANLFWIEKNILFTTPLSEGCVAGVMRRYIIEKFQGTSQQVVERPVTLEQLLQADEVFLTNAITGVRWVAQINDRIFASGVIHQLFGSTI